MPIYDINNTEIVHHNNFPLDEDVRHIEIGASINCFGKRFFPNCYLTDMIDIPLPHFSNSPEYSLGNCHFLDFRCNFFEIDFRNKFFDMVICCNPNGYGFRGLEFSKIFLNQAADILNTEGIIHVIGNSTNPWSKYDNASKYIEKLNESGDLTHALEISELSILDEAHIYRNNHSYTRNNYSEEAVPNQLFTIRKIN